jgi:hypothetical protein
MMGRYGILRKLIWDSLAVTSLLAVQTPFYKSGMETDSVQLSRIKGILNEGIF